MTAALSAVARDAIDLLSGRWRIACANARPRTARCSSSMPPDPGGAGGARWTAVLALLPEHGGRLERRLRSSDGTLEVHVVAFPSARAWEAYRDDPRRLAHRPLLVASAAETDTLEVTDIAGDTGSGASRRTAWP